jgi:chromosome segregation ATPase
MLEKLRKIEEEKSVLSKKCSELDSQIKKSLISYEELEEKLWQESTKKELLQKDIQDTNEQLSELSTKKLELEQKLAAAEHQFRIILSQSTEDKDKANSEIQKKSAQIKALEEEIQLQKEDYAVIMETQQKEISKLSEKVAELEKTIENLKKNINNLSKELEQKESVISCGKTQVDGLVKQNQELAKSIEEEVASKETLSKKFYEELEVAKKAHSDEVSKLKNLNEEAQKAENERLEHIKILQSKIGEITQKLEDESRDNLRESNTFKKSIQEKDTENEELK